MGRANKGKDEREKKRGREEEGKREHDNGKKDGRQAETDRDRHTKVQALHHNKTHTTSS